MTLEGKKEFLKKLHYPVDDMENLTIEHVYERNKDNPEKFAGNHPHSEEFKTGEVDIEMLED